MARKNDRTIEVTFRITLRATNEDGDKWSVRKIDDEELPDFVETVEGTFNQQEVVREVMAGSDCFVAPVTSKVVAWKELASAIEPAKETAS